MNRIEHMTQHLLVQLQLSNYDANGVFILEADSGFQMCFGRIREMLKLNNDLMIDVIGPHESQVRTSPHKIVPDLFDTKRVRWLPTYIIPNALATRYDFNMSELVTLLFRKRPVKYDAVYVNDPMLLRNYRALFFLYGKYMPKFFVHSHFIDNPECPKFPTEASLWQGQVEAARKADFNFWQCETSMNVFFDSMSKECQPHVVEEVKAKSLPWDDGYSVSEITQKPDLKNVRFDLTSIVNQTKDKVVLFVPNRIGGRGRSSDYTNCGKFVFDIVPEIWKRRQDFVVITGNPSQKFSNSEVSELCPAHLNIVPDAPNRDEYRLIATISDIVGGFYDSDTFGGTASRECVELGCVPLWIDCNEYSKIAKEASVSNWLAKSDFSDIVDVTSSLIDKVKEFKKNYRNHSNELVYGMKNLQHVVRNRCSYEVTSAPMMKIMGLL